MRRTSAAICAIGLLATAAGSAGGANSAREKLLMVAYPDSPRTGIYSANADGGGLRRLARGNIWETSWSPQARKVAYERRGAAAKRGIWVMNADGRGTRRLASRGSVPEWSPSGKHLAFEWKGDIWVMDASGRGKRNLTRNPARDFKFEWSPDAQTIAFFRAENRDADWALWLMDADGGHQRLLIDTKTDYSLFRWSPLGGQIAVTRLRDLIVVNADGSGLRRLARLSPRDLEWSPDGRRIVFNTASVFVVGADGSGRRQLTPPGTGRNFEATWSPDGSRLAFMGDYTIFTMDADGGNMRRLTGTKACEYGPKWSPDGKTIAFKRVAECDDGPGDIWVIGADGAPLRNVTARLGKGRPGFYRWHWLAQPRPTG